MQTFVDTVTGNYHQFEDSDDVRLIDGVYQVFNVNGERILAVPETLVPGELPTPPEPTLDDLKAAKLSTINAKAQATVAPYLDAYPRFEVDTWGIQKAEAENFALDPESPTPFADIAAAGRGIDREVFLVKVKEKADYFTAVSAQVAGYRQGLEDQVDDAETVDELERVVWVDPFAIAEEDEPEPELPPEKDPEPEPEPGL